MVLRWLLVGLVVIAPASVFAEPRRTAVVVIGDPEASKVLADAVARRLSAIEAVELLGVARVAPSEPPPAGTSVASQLAAAIDRFYDNQLEAALGELTAIERQLRHCPETSRRARHSRPEQIASAPGATDRVPRQGFPRVTVPEGTATEGVRTKAASCLGCEAAADRLVSGQCLSDPSPASHAVRVEVALWRAAVLERQWADAGRSNPAPGELREAVRAALRLDPDLRIPMETFWPRFAEFVESERRSLPRVELQVRGLPATAAVYLEGRATGRRAEVLAGTYQLRVAADGYLTHTETIDLRGNVERTLRLSPSLPTAAAAALRRGDLDNALRPVRELAGFDRAEIAIVVDVEPQRGRVAVDRDHHKSRSPVLEHREMVDWITRAVLTTSPEISNRWRWELAARLGFASTGTSFTWGNSSISSGRSGGGVALGVSGQRARWIARMDVKLERDAVVAAPQSRNVDPAPTTGRSGWLGTAEWSAGVRVGGDGFGPSPAHPGGAGIFEFIPRLRVGLRTHRTGTLVYPGGDDPLTSGYTALGLGLGAVFRVRPIPRLSIEAGFAVDPLAVYLESPQRAGAANPPEVASASAVTALYLGAGWVGELGVAYDRIEIQHVGMPQTHLVPGPLDARRLDEAFLFWIGARRPLI